ncbi:MAG: hypothetical protein C3F11_09870 [Methylocystaceae bacterium]|nr:MAG: hypothetical protein C3F11_09870 [Methylocystaceae bacterium]
MVLCLFLLRIFAAAAIPNAAALSHESRQVFSLVAAPLCEAESPGDDGAPSHGGHHSADCSLCPFCSHGPALDRIVPPRSVIFVPPRETARRTAPLVDDASAMPASFASSWSSRAPPPFVS